MPNLQKILFVGCLYRSTQVSEQFERYAAACQKTMLTTKELFPNSIFELHVDESVDSDSVKAFSKLANVIQHKYPIYQKDYDFAMDSSAIMRRKNSCQLTKCMRLNVLFNKQWQQKFEYCIVVDVHDDFMNTCQLILKYLAQMSQGKNYLLTNWKSIEPNCPYDQTLNKTDHMHFDAGLVIVKKSLPSRRDFSFEEFCIARTMTARYKLAKASEEILIDEYLKSFYFYEKYKNEILLVKHECKVDALFYSAATLATTNPKPVAIRKRPVIIQNHAHHSLQMNKDMAHVHEIYVCTELPLYKRKSTTLEHKGDDSLRLPKRVKLS